MNTAYISVSIETPDRVFTWLISNKDIPPSFFSLRKKIEYNKRVTLLLLCKDGSVKQAVNEVFTDTPDELSESYRYGIMRTLGEVYTDLMKRKGNAKDLLSSVIVLGIENIK